MGGACGRGVGFILAYEAEGFTSVLKKRHIFKATGGAIMGGRMEGCLNGGRMGGRFSAYMVGRRRGVGYTYEAFFTSKNAIF